MFLLFPVTLYAWDEVILIKTDIAVGQILILPFLNRLIQAISKVSLLTR